MRNDCRTPVIVVGYNRAHVLKRALDNLSKCIDFAAHQIYVYLDGVRKNREDDVGFVSETRTMVELFCKEHPNVVVIHRSVNLGCLENIVQAISEILETHGRMMLIEDDVLVSRTFLQYMDEALSFYEDDKRIWSVNAYQCRHLHIPTDYPYDVYLNVRNWTPGWGTWRDRWASVDFDLSDWNEYKCKRENVTRIDNAGAEIRSMLERQANNPGEFSAWDVLCTYHMIKNGLYSIEPRFSLTKNIGFGMRAEHCVGANPTMPTQKYYNFHPKLVRDLQPSDGIVKQFRYLGVDPRFVSRLVRKLKRIWWGLGPSFDEPVDISV